MENITLEIPKNIKMILKQRSREEYIDEDTALKQLLHLGVEEYAVKKYSKGEISIERAAELLEMDIYEMHDILEKHGVKSSISYRHFVKGIERAKKR